MGREGIRRGIPLVDAVSGTEMIRLQDATLEIMRTVGIVVEDEKARKIFAEAGCLVDEQEARVRFPEKVVHEYIGKCPSTYALKTWDEKNEVQLGSNGERTFLGCCCGLNLLDLDTGMGRKATRKEFYDNIVVLDYLEHVDMLSPFPLFGFLHVPDCMAVIESAAAKLRVGGKAQIECSVTDEYIWTEAMAKAVGADIGQVANSSAPYTYYQNVTDRIQWYAEHDTPIQFAPGPFKGITCPVTNAGAVAANNAETLAGMIYAQIHRPGTRVWAASMMITPNMANVMPAFGDVGQTLHEGILNQSWRSLQIPSVSCSNSWTSSMVIDYQAGYELAMMILLSAMQGASMVQFFGSLHAQLTYSPVKAIIDNDVAGFIKRYIEGVRVNDASLALDVIKEVGTAPNNFMDEDHTIEYWKSETFIPQVANRQTLNQWNQNGRKNTLDFAREKYEDIIRHHNFNRLTDSQEQEIEYILNDARNYYRKKGQIDDVAWANYQKDISSKNYPYA